MNYTPEQKQAIECVEKDLAVTAGAGTGKTRVLVDRIIYILQNGYADIDEIVAITYTNKAALEIKERLREELKGKTRFIERLGIAYIGTIHSFCFRLLKENPVEGEIDSGVKVLEEYRSKALLRESVQMAVLNNLEDENTYNLISDMGYGKLVSEIYEIIIKMRNLGIDVKRYRFNAETGDEQAIETIILEAQHIFDDKKYDLGVIDFEDILQKTCHMLENNPDIRSYYKQKLKYIMVDEYQDLNFIQDKILRLLSEDVNLFVVGDKKQSIYGFRGARVELFEKLKEDLARNGQSIILKDNFRSEHNLIRFVNNRFSDLMPGYEVINSNRKSDLLPNVYFLINTNEGCMAERKVAEAQNIVNIIIDILTSDDIKIFDKAAEKYRKPKLKDIAVLLRKRTHLNHYLKAFDKYNIPYFIADAAGLLDSPCVKYLLLALKTIEKQDKISLYGVLSGLFLIEDEQLAKWTLSKREINLEEDIENVCTDGEYEELISALRQIRMWIELKDRLTLCELADKIIEDTNLFSLAANYGSQDLENLFKLLDLCKDYDNEGYSLEELLIEIDDFGDEQKEAVLISEDDNAVEFITIHSSKGLEFPIVILADSDSEFKPHFSEIIFEPELGIVLKKDKEKMEAAKGFIKEKEIAEAKRLLYVATTRARDILIISGTESKKESFFNWLYSDEITDSAIKDAYITVVTSCEEDEKKTQQFLNYITPENKLGQKEQTQYIKKGLIKKHIEFENYFSVTALGEYLRCPRKYYLNYVKGIPENWFFTSSIGAEGLSGAQRGNIVHGFIEKHHNDILKAEEILKKQELCENDCDFIKQCLSNYSNLGLNKCHGEIFAELPFIYQLQNRRYITGKIDRLVLTEGEAEIIDFKTNAQIDDDIFEAYELQIKSYALAIRNLYNVKIKKGIIVSLYEGKIYDIDVSDIELKKFEVSLTEIIDNLVDATLSYPKRINCGFCGFKGKICK